eukprot:CAMPEP_0119562138 /NCGR_PEP_ID=MMETSP1352-20130426/19547_1 /TAXON_ID=265584 /ORGANISM="Stauroneis constricta, Strain CCMP1120" /LENGTH=322 /DNA_ID=CAMNT_0007610485 /DNA_START=129 /DNA_END=1097 /DNA_ORIENTATION=-
MTTPSTVVDAFVSPAKHHSPSSWIEQQGKIAHPSSSTMLNMVSIPLLGRFRKKKDVPIDPITVGDSLPDIDIEVVANGNSRAATIAEVVGGEGMHILVGMPGAYTPTCSSEHLPGFREAAPKLKAFGVGTIAIVTTNDKFVNDAWAKDMGIIDATVSEEADGTTSAEEPLITMIADGDADLVKQLGMVEDMGFGMGLRSKRFALLVQNGVVNRIEIDDGLELCENTSAQNLLKILTPETTDMTESAELDANLFVGVGFVALALLVASMSGGGGGSGHDAASTVTHAAPAVQAAAPDFMHAVKTSQQSSSFPLLEEFSKGGFR